MYEHIAIGFYCFIIGTFLTILIHDLSINASGYVFDISSQDLHEKRWGWQNHLDLFSENEGSFWCIVFPIFGVFGGILLSALWPLTTLALLILSFLHMARAIVRKGKKSMEEHVKKLHNSEK